MAQKINVLDNGRIEVYTDNGKVDENGVHTTELRGDFNIDLKSVERLLAMQDNRPLFQVKVIDDKWYGAYYYRSVFITDTDIVELNEKYNKLEQENKQLKKELSETTKSDNESNKIDIDNLTFWQRVFYKNKK